MNYVSKIKEAYPTAMKGVKLTGDVNNVLTDRGLKPKNTLFATSTCPDEINRNVTQLATYWGENFTLGGLAGIPFTGETGFGAYSHHVQEGGTLFILYASHVGIDREGNLGSCERKGQKACSSSCGSAVGAYKGLVNNPDMQMNGDGFDLQQKYMLDQVVRPSFERIKNAADPMAELPVVVYEKIKRKISKITSGYDGDIVLLGGIQINTPCDDPDFFVPLDFRIINPAKGEEQSLLEQLIK